MRLVPHHRLQIALKCKETRFTNEKIKNSQDYESSDCCGNLVGKLSKEEVNLSMLSFPANVTSEIKGSIKNSRTQVEVILEKIGLHALEDMELQNPGTH